MKVCNPNLEIVGMAGLYAALEAALRRAGDAIVIECGGRSLRGNEVVDGIELAAGVLAASGVRPGERVLVQVEKSVQAVFLYLATLRQGAVIDALVRMPLRMPFWGHDQISRRSFIHG